MTDQVERSADISVDDFVPAGERLCQAREARNLTVEDVAARLNISAQYIRAIETSEIKSLPSLTFVRGYIRAYARYMELDGDKLIEDFNRQFSPDSVKQVASINTLDDQVKLSDTPIRLSVYLFFLAVIGISVWWWQTQTGDSLLDFLDSGDTPALEQQIDAAPGPGQESIEQLQPTSPTDIQARLEARRQQLEEMPADSAVSEALASEEEPTYLSQEEIERLSSQLEETPSAEPAEAQALPPSEPMPSAEEPVESEPEVASQPIETPDEPVETLASEPEPAVEPVMGKLSMEFVSDCWVSIRDASGKLVFASTKHAGETLNIELETPAKLLVGRVSAVSSATFNDRTLDLETDSRKDVARLQLQ